MFSTPIGYMLAFFTFIYWNGVYFLHSFKTFDNFLEVLNINQLFSCSIISSVTNTRLSMFIALGSRLNVQGAKRVMRTVLRRGMISWVLVLLMRLFYWEFVVLEFDLKVGWNSLYFIYFIFSCLKNFEKTLRIWNRVCSWDLPPYILEWLMQG